ncbi:MAG: phytanoyl-CoA dioxygenase family protein [Phycisphaeraceae bacterium]
MSQAQPQPVNTSEASYNVEPRVIDRHAPDLYAPDATADPLIGLESVEDHHVELYHSQGFLAIEQAIPPEYIADGLEGMTDLVLGKYPDFRGIAFEASVAKQVSKLTGDQRLDAMRKLVNFVEYEPRLKRIADYAPLLDVIRRLMRGRTPELYKNQALSKPPKIGREKPWHQDCAYFNVTLDTPVVGCWIALDEVTIDNGCMHVLAGGHQQGPIPHWQRRDWQICDTDIYALHEEDKPVVAVPLKPGGLLLFSGLLPHGTPHNDSPKRRRALQYHYKPADAEECPREDRLAIWGTEGKDVEC